jgi:hypothetical protein
MMLHFRQLRGRCQDGLIGPRVCGMMQSVNRPTIREVDHENRQWFRDL